MLTCKGLVRFMLSFSQNKTVQMRKATTMIIHDELTLYNSLTLRELKSYKVGTRLWVNFPVFNDRNHNIAFWLMLYASPSNHCLQRVFTQNQRCSFWELNPKKERLKLPVIVIINLVFPVYTHQFSQKLVGCWERLNMPLQTCQPWVRQPTS